MNQTFSKDSAEYAQWMIDLKTLAFERAIEDCDYYTANIRDAQKEYWIREEKRRSKVKGDRRRIAQTNERTKTMTKLNPVGSNQTEIERENGITILYSYKTPVAAFVPGKGALCTNQRYSVTTSKHVNQAVARWGATRTNVDQGVIDQYAA